MKDNQEIKEPKIGDKIFIPSALYVYRGEDDIDGGLATINLVKPSDHLPKDHFNYWMVGFEETGPGRYYNWRNLMQEQAELEIKYVGKKAQPNPDLRPEFNQPDADWKMVIDNENDE